MILVDFSQVAITTLTCGQPTSLDESFIRHSLINMLRSFRAKYHKEYGELVIACDRKKYWREDYFPYYKGNRKEDKEKSKIDWKSIYKGMDTVITELKDYFPYPVIHVSGAEGDDVIHTIVEWSQTNDLITDGMWHGDPKPLLILSADGDQVQNQRYPNVKQYSPMKKKWLTPDGLSVEKFIREHIAEGDSTDGVPNVLSMDNCLVDGIRQKSLIAARRKEFIDMGIDGCKNDDERKNYIRNQNLIDFRFIPKEVKDNIIEEFEDQLKKCSLRGRKRVMSYLIKNRMKLMIDNLTDF